MSGIADDIFRKAGVDKSKNMELWNEACTILSESMAWCSVMLGMSARRVKVFEEQKQTLVDDLIGMRERGELAV